MKCTDAENKLGSLQILNLRWNTQLLTGTYNRGGHNQEHLRQRTQRFQSQGQNFPGSIASMFNEQFFTHTDPKRAKYTVKLSFFLHF